MVADPVLIPGHIAYCYTIEFLTWMSFYKRVNIFYKLFVLPEVIVKICKVKISHTHQRMRVLVWIRLQVEVHAAWMTGFCGWEAEEPGERTLLYGRIAAGSGNEYISESQTGGNGIAAVGLCINDGKAVGNGYARNAFPFASYRPANTIRYR